MKLCGTPDDEFMRKITSEEARNYIKSLPVMKRQNFKEFFKGANPNGKFQLFIQTKIKQKKSFNCF